MFRVVMDVVLGIRAEWYKSRMLENRNKSRKTLFILYILKVVPDQPMRFQNESLHIGANSRNER